MQYKIHSRESNILKNPELDLVLARVDSNVDALQTKSPTSRKNRDEMQFLTSPDVLRKRAKSLAVPSMMKK